MTDLRLFDLNLLIAFDALMVERNVTRAAERLGIGQPAMSHALSRLRELFADDLFVRTSLAMQPTTRALELAPSIARVIADIRNNVLADRAFDPGKTEMTFRFGTADHREVAALPKMLEVLRRLAPRSRLIVRRADSDNLSPMLESGAIDLAMGHFPEARSPVQSEVLFHEEFVCVFDAKACNVPVPLSLDDYLSLPHIVMSVGGEPSGIADPVLANMGKRRFVFMVTPHFLAVPYLLHGFRGLAAMPRHFAEHCQRVVSLAVSPLPIKTDGYDVSIYWHARTDTDPAHRWFRNLVREAMRPEAASP